MVLEIAKKMSVENGGELEVLEAEIYEFLPALGTSELEALCQKIDLDCPTGALGKKNMLLRLINKHLAGLGETEDQGFATIKIIHTALTKGPEDSAGEKKFVLKTESPDIPGFDPKLEQLMRTLIERSQKLRVTVYFAIF